MTADPNSDHSYAKLRLAEVQRLGQRLRGGSCLEEALPTWPPAFGQLPSPSVSTGPAFICFSVYCTTPRWVTSMP